MSAIPPRGGSTYGSQTLNGSRYMLLEVSAIGARDRLSTSHYQGVGRRIQARVRTEVGSPGVPSETWDRAVGDRELGVVHGRFRRG